MGETVWLSSKTHNVKSVREAKHIVLNNPFTEHTTAETPLHNAHTHTHPTVKCEYGRWGFTKVTQTRNREAVQDGLYCSPLRAALRLLRVNLP